MSDRISMTGRISLRAPIGLFDRMAELARLHGRGACEEIRLALYTHDCRATLRWLDTPEAAIELGDQFDATRTRLQTDLEACETAAFERPSLQPTMN